MRLNDYPVIHRAPHREAGRPGRQPGLEAVIVYRENDSIPFVVATWSPSMGTTWHQGDYCHTLTEAVEAFNDRAGIMAYHDPDAHSFPTRTEW